MRVSAILVTFNEENNIRDALESITWADEIIVVDSFSTDRTVEICREYTARVYQRAWQGFIDQKNYALDLCQATWVFNLDADERVSPELKASILKALDHPRDCVGFVVNRHTSYLGKWIDHSGWYPDYVLRLFRKDKGLWTGYEPHAAVTVTGKVGRLEGDLYHYSYRDIAHHLEVLNRYSTSTALAYLSQGRKCRWSDLTLRPVLIFIKKYLFQQGFRDVTRGLVVSTLCAFSVFCKYAKMWEARLYSSRRKQSDFSKNESVSDETPSDRADRDSSSP